MRLGLDAGILAKRCDAAFLESGMILSGPDFLIWNYTDN